MCVRLEAPSRLLVSEMDIEKASFIISSHEESEGPRHIKQSRLSNAKRTGNTSARIVWHGPHEQMDASST